MNAAVGTRAHGRPWYAQFWPWFLIALPGVSIAVSLLTVVLAVGHADSLVGDDWYKRGLAINQDLERDAAALRRGLTATVTLGRGELVVTIAGDVDEAVLAAELHHPTLAARDRVFVLAQRGSGRYVAAAGDLDPGRWYVSVTPTSRAWRLAAPLRLAPDAPARLVPAS